MPVPPALRRVRLGGDPAAWAAAGFSVDGDGRCVVGEVALMLEGGGGGIHGWDLAGDAGAELDGLPTAWLEDAPEEGGAGHPNGVTRIDHLVVLTDSLERTLAALRGAGAEVRRVNEDGPRRQAFLWLGDVICEVVETPGEGPARFWGLTLVADDLEAAAARLGDSLGPVRDAVQPGRRIATVRREAGLGVPVALMTPHVGRPR